ncbi:helicase-related protein [Flavonifractor porci]|uniref:helicase-related protein n=1 Tax=Flavonifractor porci TaxID=3133422 RepID=UPI0030A4A7F4
MQDYVSQLLCAINNYNPDDSKSVDVLRDLVCWVSDSETLKNDKIIAELLYIASQKMRVFGYNMLNKLTEEPLPSTGHLGNISAPSITNLYRSKVSPNNILDKSQQEVVDLFQNLTVRRLLVSAPTSYGKTFLMREIVFLNKDRYHNILLVFPTVALLLENARMMQKFVSDNELDYQIVKTVDVTLDDETNYIFVFTPERALQLIAAFPNLRIDFFFFDEVYKIDEDYCTDGTEEDEDKNGLKNSRKSKADVSSQEFLNEDRGKTFRIALYLLAKTVDEYYLAGPNLAQEHFGIGMKRFLSANQITVKEISFEPTLRIAVNAYNTRIEEKMPECLPDSKNTGLIPSGTKINDRIKEVVSYIDNKKYGKTLLYCNSPRKAAEYSVKLAGNMGKEIYDTFPDSFKMFIRHIQKEYDIDHSADEWSFIQVLKKGFGIHHGKLPKYIQQEVLDQFNKGTFDIMFCTSTIVEGVNTDAQNMIILNASKGGQKLTPFDIKNIIGRAGRYYHCFVGRVFYVSKELVEIEHSESLSLDFVTYSDKSISVIDLDNADMEDLSFRNKEEKARREETAKNFILAKEIFAINRTVSRENQEKLAEVLIENEEFSKYANWIAHSVDVENFLQFRWISKILDTYYKAGLIDERTKKRFSAIANSYYSGGFKAILEYEIDMYRKGKRKTMDDAYSHAFNSRRDILEHKIPKILSLFESVITFIANKKNVNVENFSLSKVCRYYETGVKTSLGEALIEYGFPTDAIRRIEEKYRALNNMSVAESKQYCREHYQAIRTLFDDYENFLFIKAMRTL